MAGVYFPLRCAVLKLNQGVSRVALVYLPVWRGMRVHHLHYLPVGETSGGFLFARFGRPTETGSVAVICGSHGTEVSVWTLAVVVVGGIAAPFVASHPVPPVPPHESETPSLWSLVVVPSTCSIQT